MTSLDPITPAQHAWAAGYRAGFYPDDYEPIPDTPGTDDWIAWVDGYWAGCETRHDFVKEWGKTASVSLHPLRTGRPSGGKRQGGEARGYRGSYGA